MVLAVSYLMETFKMIEFISGSAHPWLDWQAAQLSAYKVNAYETRRHDFIYINADFMGEDEDRKPDRGSVKGTEPASTDSAADANLTASMT